MSNPKATHVWKTKLKENENDAKIGRFRFRYYVREKIGDQHCTRRVSAADAYSIRSFDGLTMGTQKPREAPSCKTRPASEKKKTTKQKRNPSTSKANPRIRTPAKKKQRPSNKPPTGTPAKKKQQPSNKPPTETPAKKSTESTSEAVKQSFVTRAKNLRTIYHSGYKFPPWAIEKVQNNFDELMRSVRVYYPESASIDVVKKLYTEREPVNIETRRHYYLDKLKETFGWSTGFYSRYFADTDTLAPNIAVYTPTFVNYNGNTNTLVHIINSIGYAFDSVRQPDFKFFIKFEDNRRTELLIEAYKHVFKKIYRCAKDLKMNTVVMSMVGGNNFAVNYRGSGGTEGIRAFQENVWVPAFLDVWKRNRNLKTVFMGAESEPGFKKLNNLMRGTFRDTGRFPSNIARIEPSKTLFVNAWDPLSLPGNGNSGDHSLDGFIGRVTNIAVNGSGMTNPFAKFLPVK